MELIWHRRPEAIDNGLCRRFCGFLAGFSICVAVSQFGSSTPSWPHTAITSTPVPEIVTNTSTFVERIRQEIASASIDLMLADTDNTDSPTVDVGDFCDLVDEALDTIGVRGVLREVFETQAFRTAFDTAAIGAGMTNLRTHYETQHMMVSYENLPNFRGDDRFCTGCLWWLRHYVGTIIADKLLRDGSLRLESNNGRLIRKPEEFMAEIQRLQRLDDADFVTVSTEHAFVWQYITTTQKNLDTYPTLLAWRWCRDYMTDVEYHSGLTTDLGRECVHSFGHTVFYAVAKREAMDRYGITDYSARTQFRPHSFTLSKASIDVAHKICEMAPTEKSLDNCYSGVQHSLDLLDEGGERISIPTRVAMLGSGIFATQTHAPILREHPQEFSCRAVWSRKIEAARALAKTFDNAHQKCDAFGGDGGLNALLTTSEIDAVIIALPLDVQPQYVLQALEAGKHVLSEKPVAATVKIGLETIKAYRELYQPKGLVWSVAEDSRYSPIYIETAAAVRSTIGVPQSLSLVVNTPMDPDSIWMTTDWRAHPSWGDLGFFVDGFVHEISGLRLVVEPSWPEEVSAIFTNRLDHIPGYDALTAKVKFDNGMVGIVNATYGGKTFHRSLQVKGSKGQVELIFRDGRFHLTDGGRKVSTPSNGGKVAVFKSFARDCNAATTFLAKEGYKSDICRDTKIAPDQALSDVAFLEICLESSRAMGAPRKFQGVANPKGGASTSTAISGKRACSCTNYFPQRCERAILREHKMGTVLSHSLLNRYQGIDFKRIELSSFPSDPDKDYRHVVIFRSLLDSMVSGYLCHKSGRECWLNPFGVQHDSTRYPLSFWWESYLRQPHRHMPPANNRSICTYLEEEKESVGMRVYMDIALQKFYDGLLPYKQAVDGQKDSGRSIFVCYEELSHPDTQQAAIQQIIDWLYPGGHVLLPLPKLEREYSGPHATSKAPALRARLYKLARKYDADLFNGTLASTDKLFGCSSAAAIQA